MDWSRPPGRDSHWVGYTLDRHKYPNDPRGLMHAKQQGEHGLTSPQIVYIQGRRFLFVGGMFASHFIDIFRFDGGIAIPAGLILQWGNNLYNTDLKWPPHKPSGTSIWRDANGDGDYQAEEFAPNAERVKPGPFLGGPAWKHLAGLRLLPLRLLGPRCPGQSAPCGGQDHRPGKSQRRKAGRARLL